MKKLIIALAVSFGLGIFSASAQDDPTATNKTTKKTETTTTKTEKKSGSNDMSREADKQDRSKAGNVVNETGHGVKEGGKEVKKGTAKGWDKTKHNKATKNVFNQPGDE